MPELGLICLNSVTQRPLERVSQMAMPESGLIYWDSSTRCQLTGPHLPNGNAIVGLEFIELESSLLTGARLPNGNARVGFDLLDL